MSLEEKINKDLTEAVKAKDQNKVSSLRMLKADIESVFIQKKRVELKDEDVIKVIKSRIKKHKESIEQFTKGNRTDLADKEKKELEVLKPYAPQEMPKEKIEKLVKEAIAESGATSKKEMGKVMKLVMSKAGGKADGKTVSQIVSGLLK